MDMSLVLGSILFVLAGHRIEGEGLNEIGERERGREEKREDPFKREKKNPFVCI